MNVCTVRLVISVIRLNWRVVTLRFSQNAIKSLKPQVRLVNEKDWK